MLKIPIRRRFCNKNGFSLVELIVVILIIAILAVAVFAGGSAAIKKAHIARATSDLHNFQIAAESMLNEQPRVANIAATNKANLEGVMDNFNNNLSAEYKLTAIYGTISGNITKDASTTEGTNFIVCQSDKTDPWGNPYYVLLDRMERGGSAASEFYLTAVSAGPNAILHLDGAIDVDDLFVLVSYVDGEVTSGMYDISDRTPTIADGSAPATSYTDEMLAPVNSNITLPSGGEKDVPGVPVLSETSGRVVVNDTRSFTVTRDGAGAVSATTSSSSIATVVVNGTTVTVTGKSAGTATISVSVAGDARYSASDVVTYTITVVATPPYNPSGVMAFHLCDHRDPDDQDFTDEGFVLSNYDVTLTNANMTRVRFQHGVAGYCPTLTINGSTYTDCWFCQGNMANIVINNGTFTGCLFDRSAGDTTGGHVTITGGTFTNCDFVSGVQISGGTFDQDVSEFVISGYVCQASGGGIYTVVAG